MENICPEGEKEYRCTWQHNLYPAGTLQLGLYQNIKAGCRGLLEGGHPARKVKIFAFGGDVSRWRVEQTAEYCSK